MVIAMKRIISLLISFVIAIQPVSGFAKYYAVREYPEFNGFELKYEEVDISDMEDIVARIEQLSRKPVQRNKLTILVSDCLSEYYKIYNAYAIANISYDRNMTDENFSRLSSASTNIVSSVSLLSRAVCSIYESQYYGILTDVFGDEQTALDLTLPEDSEITDLLERELELTNRYNEIYGDSDACAELYLELVKIRNEMAEKMGYDNYAEYANEVVYDRSFTDEELDELHNGVVAYFKPLYMEAAEVINMMEYVPVNSTLDDVLLDTRMVMGKINEELFESFDYMISSNLYDIDKRDTKNVVAGAYTMYLPNAELPFLYIYPIFDYDFDSSATIQSLIHEFGHFSSMLNSPATEYGGVFETASIETSEVQSQGLELLSEAYYGELFGDAAPYQRYCLLLNLVYAVVSGCYFNEWQTQVYELEDPTVEQMNKIAKDLAVKYMGEDYALEDAQVIWTTVSHNFVSPMYYLSYALAGIVAFDLYSQSISDYDGAVDKYMQISAEGQYKNFNELLCDYNFEDTYDISSIERISNSIESMFALGYPDVKRDAWYMPYVYTTSNLIHGRAENTFMPDIPITRSEFVGAIGRMYDYYEGIDGEYENTFSDVGVGDENIDYIAWATGEGIVSGYDDATFGGNNTLTREEASAIIHRLDETDTDKLDADFTDFDSVSDWAKPSVVWAAETGLINGHDNGEFCPKDTITRAETSKILSEYLQYRW